MPTDILSPLFFKYSAGMFWAGVNIILGVHIILGFFKFPDNFICPRVHARENMEIF